MKHFNWKTNENPPEESGAILVSDGDFIDIGYYILDKDKFLGSIPKLTHWKPLPLSPREAGEC